MFRRIILLMPPSRLPRDARCFSCRRRLRSTPSIRDAGSGHDSHVRTDLATTGLDPSVEIMLVRTIRSTPAGIAASSIFINTGLIVRAGSRTS